MARKISIEVDGMSATGKSLQRFKRLSGSLEALISCIAQDWESAANNSTTGEEEESSIEIQRKMRKAQLLFSELHSTARKTHVGIEGFRNKVATAKQSMDLNHLQLSNLLYERDHLSRETQLCKDFTMSEVNKMEEDEEQAFLEDIDTLQTREEHSRNLQILKEQKDKRTNAQLELEAVQIRVKAANAAVKDSAQYLEKLPDYLKDVEKALVPLKKNMPWRPGTRRGRHEQAADLPGALFTLYCQLEAYCDSIVSESEEHETVDTSNKGNSSSSSLASSLASSLVPYGGSGGGGGGNSHDGPYAGASPLLTSVSIMPAKTYVSGSAKTAAEGPDGSITKSSNSSRNSNKAEGKRASPRSNGITNNSEPECGAEKRQRRHYLGEERSELVSGGAEGKRMAISKKDAAKAMLDALKPSPLEVVLTLNNIEPDGTTSSSSGSKSKDKAVGIKGGSSSNCNSFTVRFSYLPALGIIAVCPQSPCPSSLLANLFPNDMGKDTPNPANHHGRAARASVVGVFEYPVDVLCRPYKWAQWLAGLHFSPTAGGAADNGSDMAAALNYPIEPSTRAVVAALRSRVRTHAALEVQLKIFASKGPLPVLGLQDQMNEAASNIELRSWKEISGLELQQAAKSFKMRDASKVVDAQGVRSGRSGPTVMPTDREEWERYGARYFKGVFKMKKGRGSERNVDVQFEVPAEYPLRPSLVSLSENGNAADTDGLLAISNEVNAHYDTLLSEDVSRWDDLIANQLGLIVECLVSRPVGGLGRLKRGRMRRKPVMFDRLERTFVHR